MTEHQEKAPSPQQPHEQSPSPDHKPKSVLATLPRPRLNLLLWRRDPSLRYQWMLVAITSFLMTLIVLAMTAISSLLSDARQSVQAEITVQVPPTAQGFRADAADRNLAQVTQLLDTTPGIQAIRLLSIEEVRDILRPWVGDEVELQGLPVPYVIAVARVPNRDERLDMIALKGRLDLIDPSIVVDDHAATLSDIQRLANLARYAVIICLIMTLGLLAAVTAISVNTALRMQADVLDVLFLAGASDGFIGRQFAQFAVAFSARGLAIGGGLASLCYVSLLPVFQLSALGGPWAGLSGGQAFALVLLALITLIIAGLVAQSIVMRRLRQIY